MITEERKQAKRDSAKRWRQSHWDEHIKIQREFRRKKYEKFILPLKLKPCSICGKVYEPRKMHFDHVGRKSFSIAHATRFSVQKMFDELNKCQLLCIYCHGRKSGKARHGIIWP